MVEITQQADYAVRAVLELALRPEGERVSSEEIARNQNIPVAFLTKICARLAAAGVVVTQRGVNGGVRLARSPDQITLLDVIEAIDGPITLNRCARRPNECSRDRTCAIHPIWLELCQEFRARLNGYDFAAMANRARETSTSQSSTITLFEELPMGTNKSV
jgi:Rrf2 family protein